MLGFNRTFGWISRGLKGGFRPPLAGLWQWLNGGYSTVPDAYDKVFQGDVTTSPEYSLEFDGIDQYVQLPIKHDFIQQTGVFEIEFTAKRDDLIGYHRIAYPLADIGSGLTGWRVQFQTGTNDLNMYIANDGALVATGSFPTGVDTTEEHTYKLVGDGSNIICYVDDVQVGSPVIIIGANLGGSQASNTTISSNNSAFYGIIYDFKIMGALDSVYLLNEGEGLPQDSSGNGNHATANTATWVDFAQGVSSEPEYGGVNCLSFDGTQVVGIGATYEDTSAVDISARFRITDTSDTDLKYAVSLRFKYPNSGARLVAHGGSVWFSLSNGTVVDSLILTGALESGVWVDVRGTWDGTTRRIYINGVEMISDTYTEAIVYDEAATVVLGNSSITGIYGLQGDLAYARIAGIGYWGLAEGSGLPQDTSGNGNHATTNTATWVQADGIPSANLAVGHTPAVVSGGVGQYIDTGFIPDIESEFEVTVRFRKDVPVTELMGAYDGSVKCQIGYVSSSLNCYFGNRVGTGIGDAAAQLATIKIGKTGYTINDVLTPWIGGTATGTTSTDPLLLFARSIGGVATIPCDAEISNARIWDNGTIVRDMVPLPDGKFLDKVNNVVYSNDGAGTLVTQYNTALNETVDDKLVPMPTKSQLTFDGVGDMITTPNYINGGDAIDITMELKTGSDLSNKAIFSCMPGTASDRGLILRTINSVSINLYVYDGFTSPAYSFGAGALLANTTHTIRFQWDGTVSKATLTIDGTPFQSSADIVPWTGLSSEPIRYFVQGDNIFGWLGCEAYSASADGLHSYDFTDYLGKTTGTITDMSGNENHGTLVPNNTVEDMWATRYKDASGVVVDSANYLPITNIGGVTHNNAEVFLRQTSTTLLAIPFWSSDVYYSDLITHVNFDDNVIVNTQDGLVLDVLTYDPTKTFTLAEWNKLNGAGSSNSTYTPFQDVNGVWVYDVNDVLVLSLP